MRSAVCGAVRFTGVVIYMISRITVSDGANAIYTVKSGAIGYLGAVTNASATIGDIVANACCAGIILMISILANKLTVTIV